LYDGSMHEGFWNEDEKDLRKMRWFSTKGNYKDLPKEILDSWYRDKGLALTKQPAEVKTPGPSTQPLPGAVPGPGEQAQQVSRDTAATIGFAQQQHPYFPLQRNTTWTYRSPEAVDPSMVSETVKVVEVNVAENTYKVETTFRLGTMPPIKHFIIYEVRGGNVLRMGRTVGLPGTMKFSLDI